MMTSTKCPRCNRPVQPGMTTCPYCGQALQENGAAQAHTEAQAQQPSAPQPPGYIPQENRRAYEPASQPPERQVPVYAGAAPRPAPQSRPAALVLALIGVSILAVVEAAVILLLVVAGAQRQITVTPTPVAGATAVIVQQGGTDNSGGSDNSGNPGNSDLPRGVVGQRVESAGLAVTVVQVADEPDPGVASVLDLSPEQQYIAVDVILENNSGHNIFYTSATFKLRDAQSYQYDKYPLAYRQPELDFGTLGNRDKVRGFINFVVPRSVTGLNLIYENGGVSGYSTIYIDLGK